MFLISKAIVFLSLCFFTFVVTAQTVITMNKEGGVYVIPCKINGLPLKFIFDTGASDVSLSLTEAIFMLKNGYLEESDIKGTSYAQFANGEISENTNILIREVEIAGLKLYNISASVLHTLKAPLLLGQSAIEKLGRVQINGNQLTIFSMSSSTMVSGSNISNGVPSYDVTQETQSLSGDQPVYRDAAIYDNPDLKTGLKIGIAENSIVTIIEKVNDMFYKVKSGQIEGYLWKGSFKR